MFYNSLDRDYSYSDDTYHLAFRRMKLFATMLPYAGIAGGGLMLVDINGRSRFMVSIYGASKGITNEQTAAIAGELIKGIPAGIEIDETI